MKILFFGDSITDAGRSQESLSGCGATVLGSGYVRDVCATLISESPLKYEFINRGISGNRIVDLYSRIKADAWNHNPDVLSVFIGINDLWHEIARNNGVELDRFIKVYKMLIEDTLKALPNVKIILIEPFVIKGVSTEEKYDLFLQIKQYASAVKQLAKEYGLYFLPLQDKIDVEVQKFGAEVFAPDGVHPALYGAKFIADEWVKLFNKEIKD